MEDGGRQGTGLLQYTTYAPRALRKGTGNTNCGYRFNIEVEAGNTGRVATMAGRSAARLNTERHLPALWRDRPFSTALCREG